MEDDMIRSVEEREKAVEIWLDMHEKREGIVALSPNKYFAHNEAQYDDQYYGGQKWDFSHGKGLLNLLKNRNIDGSFPIWEIGCGTGSLSLGILYNHDHPNFIISDMSTEFLKIVRNKIRAIEMIPQKYVLANYNSDNYYNKPPEESFSVITLMNALHHTVNPEGFIEDMARLLVPGGAIVFDEPCREGNALLGLLCNVYYENHKKIFNINTSKSVNSFKAHQLSKIMIYYGRRDVDKSEAEDKHFFALEQIMTCCKKCGLDLEFIPNKYFCHFEDIDNSDGKNSFKSLRDFTRFYLEVCMGYDNKFIEGFCKFSEPYFYYYDELTSGTFSPTFHGIFILKKK